MPKFLTILFIAILSLPGFGQEETNVEPLTPGGGHVIIQNNPDVPAPEAPVEEVLSDDEMIVEEAEIDRQKQLDALQAAHAKAQPLVEPVNPLDEIKKLGHEQIDAAAMMDDKVLAILQDVLKQGTMGKIPEIEVKNMIKEKTKGTFAERVFKRFPSLLNISTDVLRDKDALSGMIGVMRRKQDLKTYGIIWLVILISGLFIKKKLVKPKWPFWKRFRTKLVINTCLSALSFYIFYSYFSEELQPTINIVAKHWF